MSDISSNHSERGRNPLEQTLLDEWQRIFKHSDWDKLPDLLADDLTYSNQSEATPLRGKDILIGSIRMSFDVFEHFEYARHFSGDEGHVLEFRGNVRGTSFFGIDIIRFDAASKITDLVVMIRPMSAIAKIGKEAELLMAHKDSDGQS